MSKLTLLIGLPASGKTTTAASLLKSSGNSVRLNRDLLREMLHFNKWTGKNERETIKAERLLAKEYLLSNINVIIDDTNLSQKTQQSWSSLIDELNKDKEGKPYSFDKLVIDTPVDVCVERDRLRGLAGQRSVGRSVIRNFALLYGLVEKPAVGYVLCDIDGTIADCEHRRHFLDGDKKDWNSFFKNAYLDTVREGTRELLLEYSKGGYTVVFVTARNDEFRQITEDWLEANNLLQLAYSVIMRKTGDYRPDDVVKDEILHSYFPDMSQIKAVIDDRPSVIAMWKRHGLFVIDVGTGVDF